MNVTPSYFVVHQGTVTGPHAADAIHQGLAKGWLQATSQIADSPHGPWRTVREHPSFAPPAPPIALPPASPEDAADVARLTPNEPFVVIERHGKMMFVVAAVSVALGVGCFLLSFLPALSLKSLVYGLLLRFGSPLIVLVGLVALIDGLLPMRVTRGVATGTHVDAAFKEGKGPPSFKVTIGGNRFSVEERTYDLLKGGEELVFEHSMIFKMVSLVLIRRRG